MGEGYQVVPQALRAAQRSFEDAAERWGDLTVNDLPNWRMGDGDLGLLGRLAGVVTDYNNAVGQISGKTRTGAIAFNGVSDNLNKAACVYEAQDKDYYRQFGWFVQESPGSYQSHSHGTR